MNRYYQSVRDGIVASGLVYKKTGSVAETLIEMDMVYPFSESITLDSIIADNNKGIWEELNRYGKRLSAKLSDDIEPDESRFVMHHEFKVNGVSGKESHRYLPFTLVLGDGQVVTALVRNTEEGKEYNPKKPLIVAKWALNKQDITEAIYSGFNSDIDMATTVARLQKIITESHKVFIKGNAVRPKNEIIKEIDSMEIDLSNVVWGRMAENEELAKEKKKSDKEAQLLNFNELVNKALAITDISTEEKESELANLFEDIKKNPIGLYNPTEDKEVYANGVNRVGEHINKLIEDKEKHANNFEHNDLFNSQIWQIVKNYGFHSFYTPANRSEFGEFDASFKNAILSFKDGELNVYVGENAYRLKKGEITEKSLYKMLDKIRKEAKDTDESLEAEIKGKLEVIKGFMSEAQYAILSQNIGDKEYEFSDVVDSLYETITNLPKIYEKDGEGNSVQVQLHYFNGSSDWYIIEADSPFDAYGYTILNGDTDMAELGYMSIEELTRLGVELDFHYTKQTLGEIKSSRKEYTNEEKYKDGLNDGWNNAGDLISVTKWIVENNDTEKAKKLLIDISLSEIDSSEYIDSDAIDGVYESLIGMINALGLPDEVVKFLLKNGYLENLDKNMLDANPTDQELEAEIKENEVYKQIIKDSHGGVLYNVADADKYDARKILSLWEKIENKDAMDGIIKGAMNFLLENQTKEDGDEPEENNNKIYFPEEIEKINYWEKGNKKRLYATVSGISNYQHRKGRIYLEYRGDGEWVAGHNDEDLNNFKEIITGHTPSEVMEAYKHRYDDSQTYTIESYLDKVAEQTDSESFEKKLDEVAELIEEKGLMDEYEERLSRLADRLTELMKVENE